MDAGKAFWEPDSSSVLGADGRFAQALKSFTHRQSQVEMAVAIEQAIENSHTLIAESGTGTGKTFAYLVPALLSGKKTLISTGTKHLQEQLFYRDIPTVLKILELNVKISLLKGRANYLCLHRLQQTHASSRRLDKKQLGELEAVTEWAPHTKAGDIAELADLPEDSRLWPQLTSTVDNCLGQNCSYFEDCYVNKARKTALASDVVVINHHLFFADKALQNDGFGNLLPEVGTVIFDEAHQIPDIASNFLGNSFSSWQVMELAADTRTAELKEKSLVSGLAAAADDLDKLMADTRLSLGLNEQRISWYELLNEVPALGKKMQTLAATLEQFATLLEAAAVAGEGLSRCHERAVELSADCKKLSSDLDSDEANSSVVRWVEVARRTFRIHETPLDIGGELSSFFANTNQARIFTSATLSIAGEFEHFRNLVGLPESVVVGSWESPFDYFEQAVLYVPEGMPEPKDEGFSSALYNEVLPVIRASEGRAFVLFTSFRVMQQFEQRMVEETEDEFTILMQGERSKRELLSDFVNQPRAVLLGTMSFWEGVDVPGEALSVVIIDKLPFESPYEPVLKARLRAMQDAGENPFMSYQVPKAVITLRQGAGRLIRSDQDKGVLMICDARLRRTHYGKIFLNSLPRMRRTADQAKVCGFLNSIRAAN